MKIIEPSESLRVTCRKCGAVLELSKEDIKVRDICFMNIYTYKCPCCSSVEEVKIEKLPKCWIYSE